ncbi:MAG: ABC transporter substrate-binding protein [SAR202 cluster bacterium]|nr:ABC transporter substrate-binding protein [SAR202 cluster bacterium]
MRIGSPNCQNEEVKCEVYAMGSKGIIAAIIVSLFSIGIIGCSSSSEPAAPAQPAAAAPAQAAAAAVQAPAAPVQPAAAAPAATPVAQSVPKLVPTPQKIELRVGNKAPAISEKGPQYGGTLVQMDTVDPAYFDHHRGRTIANLIIFSNVHGNLLNTDTQTRSELVGDIATDWSISSDGLTYTFDVREGIVTHKGNSFDATDVAYNVNRLLEQPNDKPLPRGGCLRAAADEANAIDALQVEITLAAPVSSFIQCISMAYMLFQPKAILEEIDGPGAGRDLTLEEMDGMGPFQLDKWEVDSMISLKKNANYYKEGRPYLDEYQLAVLPDASTRIAAFRTGRVDMVPPFSTPKKPDVDAMKEALGDKVTFQQILAPGWRGFIANQNKAPLDDVRVRQAINIGLDRYEFNQLNFDGIGFLSAPYLGMFDWIYSFDEYFTWPGYRSVVSGQVEEDLITAQNLMKEAGYGPDNPLKTTVNCGTNQNDECAVLKPQLKEFYIDVEVIRKDRGARLTDANNMDFELWHESKGIEYGDPDAYHSLLYLPTSGINYTDWENADFSAGYEQQKGLLDLEKRGAALRDMADILYNDPVWIGVLRPSLNHGWWSYVNGYVPPNFHQATYRYDQVWLDNKP